jgi:hypothetical protein
MNIIKLSLTILFILFIFEVIKFYINKSINIYNQIKLYNRVQKMKELVKTIDPIGVGIMKRIKTK